MQGWIKIHRQIQDKAYINKPAYVSLWVNLLLLANHKEKEVMWNGAFTTIKRGQLITGRKELSKLTGIPETTIERILKVFKSGHQIEQQTYNKYRLITILNWDKHQVVDNKRTTNGHQTDTNKNVKKERSIGETSSPELKSNQEKDMWNKIADDFEEEVQIEPDYQPKKKEAKKKVADDVQAVFDLFNNPAKVTWRMREIERVAAQALFDTYGIETLKKRIKRIEQEKIENANDPFFPLVNTPSQLLDKMENVERYLKI